MTELAKQESYVSSLEQRIAIVSDNYAEPEQSRIAHDLSRLNEKKSTILSQQTDAVNQVKEKESVLAQLTAQETGEKAKSKSLHEEHSTLNHEIHELEVRLRQLEKEFANSTEILVNLREKEQDLISTSGKSIDEVKQFDAKLNELRDKDHVLTKEINNRDRQSDSLNRDLKELHESEAAIQKMISNFGFSDSIETFDVEPLIKSLLAEQKALSDFINRRAPDEYVKISEGYINYAKSSNVANLQVWRYDRVRIRRCTHAASADGMIVGLSVLTRVGGNLIIGLHVQTR